MAFRWILYSILCGKAKMRAEVLKSPQEMISLNIQGMVYATAKGKKLNIRTFITPHTNEFRLGKLGNKLQAYLALSQASLLGSFQQMILALCVCCRYTKIVL